jgi:ribonuclease BN (tRNA processing enzyme)
MRLDVIGAGPAYTDRPGAVGSSYLLSLDEAGRVDPDGRGEGDDATHLLLDLGHGAFANLAGAIEPSRLAGIAISHLHPDHFIDLVPLRHYLRYEFEPPRRLPVLAPGALTQRLDALLGEPGFTAASFDVETLGDRMVRQVGGFVVEARRVTHTEDSYAFRVSPAAFADYELLRANIRQGSGGATGYGAATGIVYSGDCGRAADLKPLIRPGDSLLTEVSFGLGPVQPGAQHLDAGDVAEIARETGVSRILLTHLLAGRDRAATAAEVTRLSGGIPAALVDPGDTFDV